MNKLTAFRNNRQGIGWVIGTALISILFIPVVYFPLSYTWDQLYAAITADYVFTGTTASSIIIVQILLSYLAVFGLFITVAWAIIQAKARRYQQ